MLCSDRFQFHDVVHVRLWMVCILPKRDDQSVKTGENLRHAESFPWYVLHALIGL